MLSVALLAAEWLEFSSRFSDALLLRSAQLYCESVVDLA